ncbi:3-oxoacyl-ACP synthase [Rhodobacteraceae bacterium D3-12]|nr:3-oxoacyl-ACP synthase [Rhodobacteraceae bacterium D3-12]
MSGGVNILASGMVTAVGLDRAASCAAMRGNIDGFQETEFLSGADEFLIGAPVPLPRRWIGERRLAHLAAGAIVDALDGHWHELGRLLLVLCLPEPERPGRVVQDSEAFAAQVREFSGLAPNTKTYVAEHGRPSGFVALDRVRAAFAEDTFDHALIVGTDSLLTSQAVTHYKAQKRLLTADNPNGFMPGEAAAAVLCASGEPTHFALSGLGLSSEKAKIYNGLDKDGADLPLRGDGLTVAYKRALDGAQTTLGEVIYRMSDLIGEAYFFKQTALARLRLTRDSTGFQDLWSPTETLGNIGAAVVPLMIGWALEAFEKGYATGSPVLIEASGDNGACGAAVFHSAAKVRRAA